MISLLDLMFPCAYKLWLGIDCPACGGQRAFYLLIRGKIGNSFLMYPPLIPVLLCVILWLLHLLNKKWVGSRFIRRFSVCVLAIVIFNYIYKLVSGS